MADVILPRAQTLVDDPATRNVSREWYEFFRQLREFVFASGLDPGVIADILARLDALEAAGETTFEILGPLSVRVGGTPESGTVVLQLENDQGSPGKLYYYRTDADGVKGWSFIKPDELPISLLGVYPKDEDGNYMVDENNSFMMTDLLHQMSADPNSPISNVQRAFDVMTSPGIITGGEVTELTTTSVRITGGTALLRVADDNYSELRFFRFASQDFSVPDVQVTHFYALDYNGGSPIMVESTVSENWDRDTQIPLGSALRGDGILNVTPNPYRTGDVITNLIQRLDAIGPVQRDNSVGGLALGETGTRNVTVSAGRLWSRVSDFTIATKNSATSSMQSVFFNGVNLTVTSGITQWDNLNFNNLGTGSLQVMGNNKYANLWFFISFNGDHYGFAYGTNEYNTLGDAANEGVPAYLTQNFFNQFILLGRFIFQKSAATANIIESAFVTPFSSAAINTHNNLGGLQGGTTGEYYHLTAADYAALLASTDVSGGFFSALGIGVSPDRPILVNSDINPLAAGAASIAISGESNKERMLMQSAAGDPVYIGLRTGGTKASPAATPSGVFLGAFFGQGHNGTATTGRRASSGFVTTELWSGTGNGTRMQVETTPNGSTTMLVRFIVDQDGSVTPGADATQTLGSSSLRWSNAHLGGALLQSGVVSPAQLTANTDNWAITGITTAAIVRASTDASRNLTGIASPTSGQMLRLINVGSFDLVLVHDATSTAANRFLLPNSANLTLNPNDSVSLWYDNTSSRWRALGV